MNLRSGDAELFYEVRGAGFPVVLLHPFPVTHAFWLPLAPMLSSRYRLLLPELRAHGRSGIGQSAATMAKYAEDLGQLLKAESIKRAVFVGVSIGGYILFEFWRRYREQVTALILANTRATADNEEGRTRRLKSIEEVQNHGPAGFLDAQVQSLIGETTRKNRPDIAAQARKMMNSMRAENIAAIQRGMAERPDSVATLKDITVPTLILAGKEDTVTPLSDAEFMRSNIAGSQLEIIDHAGHYAVFEHPQISGRVIRQFLESQNLSV
jgi:3-oxoadipate enol-lactonase